MLGCSPDSAEDHRKFIDKHDLTVRLLSDPDREVIDAYGAWGQKEFKGRVREGVLRSTVLINPRGEVAHHWPQAGTAGHAEEVFTALVAAQL